MPNQFTAYFLAEDIRDLLANSNTTHIKLEFPSTEFLTEVEISGSALETGPGESGDGAILKTALILCCPRPCQT